MHDERPVALAPGRYATIENGHFETVSFTADGKNDTFTYAWADGADLLTGYHSSGSPYTASVAYEYEDNRNLKTMVENRAKSVVKSQFDYVYDEVGRRKQRTDDGSLVNKFLYNVRSEVTGADMDGNDIYEYDYAYDDIGNRKSVTEPGTPSPVTTTYAANDLNHYNHNGTVPGAIDHQFDDDGNLENDGTWTYEWNAENRLEEMRTYHDPDSPALNDVKLAFKYDFMGRRYEKKVYLHNGFDWVEVKSHDFIYDGWNLIREKVRDNTTSSTDYRSYIWGLDLSQTLQGAGGVGGLLATVHKPQSGSTATYYPLADANGNITDYVDASGTVAAHFEYDAFGKIVNTLSSSDDDFPIRFSSKYEDVETDLNYYGFRYYASGIGRWLNRDPIEEDGGVHLFGFVLNDGVNVVDYLGLESKCTYTYIIGHGGDDGSAQKKLEELIDEMRENGDTCSRVGANGCYLKPNRYRGHDDDHSKFHIPGFQWTRYSGIGYVKPGDPVYPVRNGSKYLPNNASLKQQKRAFAQLVRKNWNLTKNRAERASRDCQCQCDAIYARLVVMEDFMSQKEFMKGLDDVGYRLRGFSIKFTCQKNAASE